MECDIAFKFNNNKETLGKFAKELTEFNKVLEDVYVTIINAINEKYLGKNIDKRFSNYVNEILNKKYGTSPNGNGYVSIAVYMSDWDNYKKIDVSIILPKFNYRFDIKNVLTTCNELRRTQYTKESTDDNKFNEGSIQSFVQVINNNRVKVARHQDAYKHFDKYMKIVSKLQQQVTETLGSINPMFYGSRISTDTYNTPNYNAFEEKLKEQGGTFVLEPEIVKQ